MFLIFSVESYLKVTTLTTLSELKIWSKTVELIKIILLVFLKTGRILLSMNEFVGIFVMDELLKINIHQN